MTDEKFGESQDTRAGIQVEVRRELNEYSGLDEVFTFYGLEPRPDAIEEHTYGVKYALTRESRKAGMPGYDDTEFDTQLLNPEKVPDEVKNRAHAMLNHMKVAMHD